MMPLTPQQQSSLMKKFVSQQKPGVTSQQLGKIEKKIIGSPAPPAPKQTTGFVGPIQKEIPVKPTELTSQEKQIQQTIQSLEDKPVSIKYETPTGEVKTFQTMGFKQGLVPGQIVSVSPLLPSGGTGRPVLVSSGPSFYTTARQEYQTGGKIPTWYRQQVTIPSEIKYLGLKKEYLKYGYETSIGIQPIDDTVFNKTIEQQFSKLQPGKQFEYGLQFGEIKDKPITEWKYYKGGTDYLKTYKEEVIDKFIKEKGGYKKFYQGVGLDPVEVAQKFSTEGGIYGGRKPTSEKFIREYSWDILSKTPAGRKESYFGKLPGPVRVYTSAFHATTGAALFPVTLPQTAYKMVTGKPSLGALDIGTKVSRAKLGPGGVISPAISEVWLGQDVSVEKQLQKKYPVETAFATAGEIFGVYVGGKGISMGFKAVKPSFISGVRTVGTKVYTQFPKGWGRAFPKLQPLRTYVYGKVPTHTNIVKTVGYDISKGVPGRSVTVTPRTVTQPILTTTGKLKYALKTVQPKSVTVKYTIPKFRYRSFQLAKTGFKRFTGMERAIGKPVLISSESTIKGFGGPSKPKHGMFYKLEQSFKKGWGKEYIPEEQYIKMGKPTARWEAGDYYYRPEGKQIVPRVTTKGTFIGESTSDIVSSVQKTIKTPFSMRFKHFIGDRSSTYLSTDVTKGSRIPRSLTLKTDVAARIKIRFGTEYGGMPKFPKGPKYPKPDAFKKTPFPKRSGWGGTSLQELEAMEEGIGTSVHSFWKGVAPSKPFFPTTMGADIATGLVTGGIYGSGFMSPPKVQPIYDIKYKPDIKIESFKIDMLQPKSDVVFKPKLGLDQFDKNLYAQIQSNLVDQTPRQAPIQFQAQLQRQQQKYMPYQPTPTVSQQVYQFRSPKISFIPSFEGETFKAKKRKPIELLGKGYRYRRWKVPRMEDLIGGY